MFKHLLALVLTLAALTSVAAESQDTHTAAMTLAAGGEIVRTAAPRAKAETVPEVKAVEASRSDVSWEMVLAAVALMTAIALRRFRSGPR